jgi:hypothetical protein
VIRNLSGEIMIPEVAHWIWLAESLPDWAAWNIDVFRSLHPEWTVRVWHELPEQFPSDLRVLFQQLPWYSSRSDIFRYWLLAEYGGVYLDTDIVTVRNFDSLLNHEFFLSPCMPTGHMKPHLACGLMGSVPGSRPALRILDACRSRATLADPPRRITYGPDLLTSLFAEDRTGLTVLPKHYFYAIPDRETTHAFWHADSDERKRIMKHFEPDFTDEEPPYAVHLWGVEGSSQRQVLREYTETIHNRPI